jgi:hypothetical protein
MSKFLQSVAHRIPYDVAKKIVDEDMINSARSTTQLHTPMHYLFLIHDKHIDKSGSYDHWQCPKCRLHVLEVFRKLQPFIKIRVYGGNDQVRSS